MGHYTNFIGGAFLYLLDSKVYFDLYKDQNKKGTQK